MTTDTALFPADLTIPIHSLLGVDRARTRRTDPETSHAAGDRSSVNVKAVKRELLGLLRRRGSLTGSEANTLYRDLAVNSDGALPIVAWDSPRKRLGELAADNLITPVDDDHPRGTETVYVLPDVSKEIAA